MNDKLTRLLARCKCGVYLTVNAHRDVYDTAEQWLENQDTQRECPPQLEPGVRARMIELNRVVELQFYPNTPISFHTVIHHNLDAALDEALACLNLSEPK